ncbi:AAA family ATPase [Spirosoma foliorum]|uniref:AAA family ATPase n=1 Tax=Spirosoma foliorum TaxID=2710596 RepID=A0A7G5H2S1_9BACT|nr:AAA family ATPase [Spirosoma foliorum]QMW05413.1 AAA family ATPase [Spirosoma foliorum]
MVVAFSGRIGSGKTTLTTELADQLGWPRTSFGDYVRLQAMQSNIDPTRENLQNLGEKLLEEDPRLFCDNVLNQIVWRSEGNLIIDGIRHVQVISLIKELVSPFEMIHVHIETDVQTRSERLYLRYSSVELQKIDNHSTELDVKHVLGEQADIVIKGDSTIASLVKETREHLKL